MKNYMRCLVLLALCASAASAQQLTPEERAALRAALPLIERLAAEPSSPEPTTDPKRQPIRVPAGGDLQAAFQAAQPGDVIELADGARFVGNYVVGAKADYVTVRGKATIHSPSQAPALSTHPKASYWRFTGGLTFTAALPDGTVIRCGTGAQTAEDIPHHFIFDGVFVLGDPARGGKRGIEANCNHVEIRNSRIAGFFRLGQDSQAVSIWNAYGPLLIDSSYLEATGENFMSGGSDPSIPNLIPADITFTNNDVTRPVEWKASGVGTVKNLFELKSAQRVVVRDNRFSNNWLHGQTGYAVVLKSTNQDGKAPWSQTSDVLFEGNRFSNVAAAFNLSGRPEVNQAVPMARVTIRNNLIATNRAAMGGDGRCFLVNGVSDVTIEHNTCTNPGASIALYLLSDKQLNDRLILRGNIITDACAGDCWGIMGSGAGEGIKALQTLAPGHVYTGNLIVTPTPWLYGPTTQNRLEATMPNDTAGYGSTLQ